VTVVVETGSGCGDSNSNAGETGRDCLVKAPNECVDGERKGRHGGGNETCKGRQEGLQ
jgi:hypothetical protein